jgi:hypothetical protein
MLKSLSLSVALPFRSPVAALLLSVVLGPLGLIYASIWGGVVMLGICFVVICAKFIVPIIFTWIANCIWAVAATNRYNDKLLKTWWLMETTRNEEKNITAPTARSL